MADAVFERLLDDPAYWTPMERWAAGWVYTNQNGTIVVPKYRQVLKFGRTLNADDGVKTLIGGLGPNQAVETFVEDNSIDALTHTNSADNGINMRIEGHTSDQYGRKRFIVQFKELGASVGTKATLDTPISRISRLRPAEGTFASPTPELTGAIYGYASEGVTLSGGVPQTATSIKIVISAGKQQSEKAQTTFSNDDWFFITDVVADTPRAQGGTTNIDIDVEIRQLGGVFRPVGLEQTLKSTVNANVSEYFDPPIPVRNNSDVRMVATSDSANTIVSGHFNGFIMARRGTVRQTL